MKYFWQKRNYFKKNKIIKNILPKNYKKMSKWKLLLYFAFYFLIVLVFVTAVAFAWFAKDLPTPSKIANRKPTESTKIYDRTGGILLYETGEQKRTAVKSDQISQYLKDATISVEDASFQKHHGFDTKALVRAVWYKIIHKTNRMTGASTITQQYVKNALLTSDRSVTRKFKELILSIELEFMFQKDEILSMYLNEIPYGNSTAGAEAASKMYFGKTSKDLTLAEAATLAAIPQAPTYYSPYGTHTKQLIARRNYVLDRMVETGKIKKDEAEKAKGEDTTTLGSTLKPRRDAILAPHFAMYVLEEVADQYGEEKVQKEGLKIITSLDHEKQKAAEAAINDNRKKLTNGGAQNAALAAVDPKTGQILAMVGSVDYFDTSIDGNVNVADSLRQPGSSFKPFEYATAFKQKDFSPSRVIYDLQTDFGNNYVPKNYNGRFNGPVTMRYALANSLNIPAIKTLALAGMDNTLRTAEDLGITTLNDRKRYGLSLAIGVGEVKPVEMAGAFGVFANSGNKQELSSIIKITDSGGKVVYDFDRDHKNMNILDPQVAYEISDILKDNIARTPTFGARSALYFPDREVAVKTGTTQENKDAWTVGYTPSIATAVWVGNNQPSPMKSGGEALAGPIFHQFMKDALANTPNEEFKAPPGIQIVTVDKFSNKLPTDQSPPDQRSTDIFASWQVPTDQDDIHIKIKVCKNSDKLAPSDLPDSLVDEKTFTNIHSEKPDNPNWENPVLAWAAENGMSNTPPKEYCNAADITPKISFSRPSDNSSLTGKITISVSASSPSGIKSVEYFIDDISIGTGNSGSTDYPFEYDFSAVASDKPRKLSAVVTDQNGATAKTVITINATKPPISLLISNIIPSGVTGTGVTINWETNLLTTGKVLYSTVPGGPYSSALESGSKTFHSQALSGLLPNTKYYYIVESQSVTETKNSSEQNFTTTP